MSNLFILLIIAVFWISTTSPDPSKSMFNIAQILDYVIEEVTIKKVDQLISDTDHGFALLEIPKDFEQNIQIFCDSKLNKPLIVYLNVEAFENELTGIKFKFLGSQSYDFEGFHIYESIKEYSPSYLLRYYYPDIQMKYWKTEGKLDFVEECCIVKVSKVEISVTGSRAAVHASNSCYIAGVPTLFLFEQFKGRWLPYASIIDERKK